MSDTFFQEGENFSRGAKPPAPPLATGLVLLAHSNYHLPTYPVMHYDEAFLCLCCFTNVCDMEYESEPNLQIKINK